MFAVLFSSCENKETTIHKADITISKKAVEKVLNTWHKNAAEANYEAYFKAMSKDGVFIGTDASENWDINAFKEFSKPYFDAGKAWNFKPIERNIYINSDNEIAWFDELLNTWMGISRGSGVLKRVGDEWKISHYVLSVTIPNETIEKVIQINKVKDSIFLSKISQ
tara:strand:+ start:1207 stop:1704 length:498 start_codon:yes stop_codon:yes gene_type:complete